MDKNKLRVLAIGAHPDDSEFRVGGTAVKYRADGHIVKFVSVTNGDTGHFEKGGAQLAKIRAEETKKACEIAGIETQVLDIHSNRLEADIDTRESLICLIRCFKPDLIITHRLNDYHPDHRRTSMLVQDCSYAIRIPNVCPLTPPLTYTPVILYMQDSFKKPMEFEADIIVNIDDVITTKLRMLDCHKSQVYEWLPWVDGELEQVPDNEKARLSWLETRQFKRDGDVSERFRSKLIEKYGHELGSRVKWAEAFEISEYGGKLPREKIPFYFPF